nr:homeodomain-like protein [Tanacetum cinerariifolium]
MLHILKTARTMKSKANIQSGVWKKQREYESNLNLEALLIHKNLLSGFNGNMDLDSLSDILDHNNGEAGDGYRLEDFVAGSGLCRERTKEVVYVQDGDRLVALKPQIGHGYRQQECSPSPFLIYDMGIKRVGSSNVEALGEGSSYMDGAIRPRIDCGHQAEEKLTAIVFK